MSPSNVRLYGGFGYEKFLEYLDKEIETIAYAFENSSKYSELLYRKVLRLILMLCPKEKIGLIFSRGCCTRVQLERLMNEEMLKYVELDFAVNPKVAAKALVKSVVDHPTVFLYKVFLLLVNKGILAYLMQFDGDYIEGFTDFRWCLQFIYHVKRVDVQDNKIKVFLEDCERMFAILCAKCLMNEIENKGDKWVTSQLELLKLDEASVLQSLLFTVADCTEPSMMTTSNYLDRYVMSIFFESLGEIERSISILKGSLAEYERVPNNNDLALRIQKDHLNDMIRRYILSMTTKLNGDPAIVRCIFKILEGLVLFGGVHMEIVQFFYSLKEYYIKTFPATFEYSFDNNLTKECIALLDIFYQEWGIVKTSFALKAVQLPQVLLKSMFGGFVLVDEVFDENRPLEHHHDLSMKLSSMKLKVKHKWFGETHTSQKHSDLMWKLGMEWVVFWKNCYVDNHEEVPSEILHIFNGIK